MKAVCAIALVGCTSAKAPVTPKAETSNRPYLKLIEPDNQWSLPIKVESGSFGTTGYKTDKREQGTVHCEIKRVDRVGEATVSTLHCDKPYDDLSITGSWVAQPNGLYHPLGPITNADDLASLLDDDLLINDQARERDHSHTNETSSRQVWATHDHGAWCVQDKTTELGLRPNQRGERRSFTLCFDDTHGIVSASEFETMKDSQTWHSVQIGANPPLDSDDPLHPLEGDSGEVTTGDE